MLPDRPTRTERDSMGPMEVPADAYYGASTQRAVLNFPVSGLRFNRGFIRVLGLIKMAAAEVNAALAPGLVTISNGPGPPAVAVRHRGPD